jgi:transglutaminase-like putative cysteine protease
VERVIANGWRLSIRHVTTSRYAGEVFASYNEARLTPLTTPHQVVLDSRVEVEPNAMVHRYWDYWGTLVHTFDVNVPHTELTVVSTAVVDTAPTASANGASWHEFADPARADQFYEFLVPTSVVAADESLYALASELRAVAPTPRSAVVSAIDRVRDGMTYERGHTTTSTSAAEAWEQGSGVCQDFAHVTLALLRAMGVPARYVSGYLHPDDEARVGDAVTGESHAWVEAWLGEWAPFDPTNGEPVGRRHVVVARGRDYGDVAPIRGVYTGAASAGQEVVVEVTRVA